MSVFRIQNTLTRQLEEFRPLEAGHARMYTCGPTVYNFAHIGNFRAYVFEDLLRRWLSSGFRGAGDEPTDVDDKTSRFAGGRKPLAESRKLQNVFLRGYRTLNVEPRRALSGGTDDPCPS
jgi:cysteinyl-tRNA synthetase